MMSKPFVSSGPRLSWIRVLAGIVLLFECSQAAGKADLVPLPGTRLLETAGISFTMGTDEGLYTQKPAHVVTLTSSLFIDTTEVTQEKFHTTMIQGYEGEYEEAPWADSNHAVGPSYPAYNVTWYDAVLYCNALSKRDGLDTVYSYRSRTYSPGEGYTEIESLSTSFEKNGYRLPTEAEFAYALRGGTTTEYYWGDDESRADEYEWHSDNAGGTMHEVASKPAGPYGLYDLGGNLMEWCCDWYALYASADPVTDPAGPDQGEVKVLRGGSWEQKPVFMKVTNRMSAVPDAGHKEIGFRTVARAVSVSIRSGNINPHARKERAATKKPRVLHTGAAPGALKIYDLAGRHYRERPGGSSPGMHEIRGVYILVGSEPPPR